MQIIFALPQTRKINFFNNQHGDHISLYAKRGNCDKGISQTLLRIYANIHFCAHISRRFI